MQKFSRWMPPLTKSTSRTAVQWIVLGVVVLALLAIAVNWPIHFALIFGTGFVVSLLINIATNRRLRQLAHERQGEDIGTFARAFDRRTEPFDPWVVRATWEALQPFVTYRGGQMPLRPTDRFDDLCVDPEELSALILEVVSERTGYSLDQTESNPYYGRIETVGDFVKFVSAQPRLATARVSPRQDNHGPSQS